jgi:hypothetical protein
MGRGNHELNNNKQPRTMLEHRRGLEPETKSAERRLQARDSSLSAGSPQEQLRRAVAAEIPRF